MKTTYFQQTCPICGRLVRIESSLNSKNVVCQHCSGKFQANDLAQFLSNSVIHPIGQREKIDDLLRKSEQFLRQRKISHC